MSSQGSDSQGVSTEKMISQGTSQEVILQTGSQEPSQAVTQGANNQGITKGDGMQGGSTH